MSAATMPRLKTDPNHKARFRVGVECLCSCGWRSCVYYGKGAKAFASTEWRAHRRECDAPAT